MACHVKKGEMVAIVTATVSQPAFGSSKPATTHYSIRLVLADSATRDGALKKFRTYPGSPVYPFDNRYGKYRTMSIPAHMQANAKRLYDAAKYFLDYDDQEKCKDAIRSA